MPPVPRGPVTAEAWITAPALPALVARVASRYQFDRQDTEDLLQETRIALWEAGQEVVGAAWVVRVASHKAVDKLRQRLRERARLRTYVAFAEGRRAEPEIEPLLHARASKLPSRLRVFYELHYVQGWSEREIATRSGLCRASVRWLDQTCRRTIYGPQNHKTRSH